MCYLLTMVIMEHDLCLTLEGPSVTKKEGKALVAEIGAVGNFECSALSGQSC